MAFQLGRLSGWLRALGLGSSLVLSVTGCGESDNNGLGADSDGSTGDASATTSGTTGAASTTAAAATTVAAATTAGGDSSTGATTGPATTAPGGGLALVDLPTAYANAYCSWIYRCCPIEQLEHVADGLISFYGTTEGECQTNMTALTLLLVPSISQGESQGRSRYDAMRAAECVDTLRTSCADIETSCQSAIEPLVEAGGACAQNNQCAGGLSCINETDSADGSCAALLGIGEACERDNDCASGACSGTCADLAAPGETCFADSACASAYCDFETNTCAEAPYSGACEL